MIHNSFRHLSPSIALKRNVLPVDLTVSLLCRDKKSRYFRRLQLSETIEWE